MLNDQKNSLWNQFGASIDMLHNAISLWPEEKWTSHSNFFYNAYHCLVFLDYYLTVPAQHLSSPLPFTLTDPAHTPAEAIDDIVPNRIYSQKELLEYLAASREKCQELIFGLTAEKLSERWIEVSGHMNYSVLELLLYNMRHVQHHTAQLNMLLRKEMNNAPQWVGRVGEK